MRSSKTKPPDPESPTEASLPLFTDNTPPSLERAMQIVARIPLDATLKSEMINGHGPYWYANFTRDGSRHRVYVGSEERYRVIAAAHDIVRAELARLEAPVQAELARVQRMPELEQARKLKEAAFARPTREPETNVIDVPIFDPTTPPKTPRKAELPKARALPRRARQGS